MARPGGDHPIRGDWRSHRRLPPSVRLAVSKLAAWREKDRYFVATLLRHGITTDAEIEERLAELDPGLASTIRPRLRSARAQ